ncbi:MAG: response regulator [Archangium sp.]|nr:response regulator [Archangium sp.]
MSARILVVDDNPANVRLAAYVLGTRGFEVHTASTPDEAMESIGSKHPDLVLMDIQLPGTDGLTLTRRLRENPETQKLIIVAFTAYAMRGDEEKALAAGCDGYLSKPIDTRTFADRISQFLSAERRPAP